ncbi:MAG: hypothetical protein H0W53_09440 [Acidobacteria bacterium]|nr:hypothetical protein [Acidobacteriota bacterium]
MSSYDKPGPLDGAIDEAVRTMTAVDPRPGLRRRVTHAISTPPRRTYGLRFGLAAVGLVAVALVSIIVWRPSTPARPVHAPQVAETAPAAPAPPLAGPQAVEAPVPPAAAPTPVRPRPRVMPTPESIFGPRQGKVAAASVPRARASSAAEAFWLDVPADAARWSAVAPLIFQPMMVAPLAIQPLFVGGLSPRR